MLAREMVEPLIVLVVSGGEYPMTVAEAGRLVDYLRAPNEYVPESDRGMDAAAVALERLLASDAAALPTLSGEECAGLLIALGRMSVQEGLPARLAAIHEALLGYVADAAAPSHDG
jgi:hypothetical protein